MNSKSITSYHAFKGHPNKYLSVMKQKRRYMKQKRKLRIIKKMFIQFIIRIF